MNLPINIQENLNIQIIVTVACTILLPLLKYLIRKIIRRFGSARLKLESRINQMVQIFSILTNLIYVITLIIIWGVDPHNLLIALSSIFAVIGVAMFAQWSLLSNITAGILIYFTSPFRAGDYIRILDKDMDFEARVEEVLTFHTHLMKKNGERVSYPNSLFFQRGISVLMIDTWSEDAEESDE